MADKREEFSREIFDRIDDLFTDAVGPVAMVLCREAFSEWSDDLESKGRRMTIRNIPAYVNKLSTYINNLDDRQNFLDAVYSIQALSIFKS